MDMTKLEEQFKNLLNAQGVDNEMNTPDYILARYLIQCLEDYSSTVAARNNHIEALKDLAVRYPNQRHTLEPLIKSLYKRKEMSSVILDDSTKQLIQSRSSSITELADRTKDRIVKETLDPGTPHLPNTMREIVEDALTEFAASLPPTLPLHQTPQVTPQYQITTHHNTEAL